MPKINDLIKYLINKNKVFPDHLLTNLPQEIFNNNDHSIEQFENKGRRDIKPGGSNNIDGWFFKISEIDSFYVEDWLDIAFGHFDFSIEELWGVFDKIWTEVSIDDAVTTWWEEKDLWDHYCYCY